MATMFYHVFTNPEFRAAAQFEHEIKEHAICKSDVRLDGKVALVTGGTSGIGKECVREFVRRGAKVILPCRYRPKGKAAKEEIENDTGKFGQVILMDLDLSSMKSVRKFADQFNKQESRLDILINNGGIMKALNTHTSEGFETIIATNYLGHFLLTHLLMDLLKKSAPSRIINVSSSAHFSGTDMMFKDFHIKSGCFGPSNFYLYCRSKAANVMHARQLQELYGSTIFLSLIKLHDHCCSFKQLFP
ncbi:DgyrCDS8994 [Dimorphilus gyrociliatus]|uniref:DgyrCDS8994 n=1 Tax=Dimorphilus gyrociliatus TaxID=2664684 RepID=A0A7I8VY16_9ANNE|nr:DgyrCDS8994 [Dimorphilus gyrociliatus]